MRLISWVTHSCAQKLPLAGSWKQKSWGFWGVGLLMNGTWRQIEMHWSWAFICLFLMSAKWICSAAQDKRVLQTLGMGVSDYLGLVFVGNRYWCGISFLTPPFLSAHLGIKEQIWIHQCLTPSPMERSYILYMRSCIMELVSCSLDLYFVLFFTFGALQACCTV